MTTDRSLSDLADGAAEAIRALNHRTLGGSGELVAPPEVCEVLAALSTVAARLPKLLGLLAAALDRQCGCGKLLLTRCRPPTLRRWSAPYGGAHGRSATSPTNSAANAMPRVAVSRGAHPPDGFSSLERVRRATSTTCANGD